MTDHELELRLRAAAHAIDAEAPDFDASFLRGTSSRGRTRIVAIAAALAIVGAAAAPAAVSALRGLFAVEKVEELGPLPADVAPGLSLIEARRVPLDRLNTLPFPVRVPPGRERLTAAYVRDDIAGGMVTLVFGDGLLLTQWPDKRVEARLMVVPYNGKAEEVKVGSLPALWIEGTARGTWTLIGADGAVHKERFDVEKGVLLWKRDGIAFLLQGAKRPAEAARLAAALAR